MFEVSGPLWVSRQRAKPALPRRLPRALERRGGPDHRDRRVVDEVGADRRQVGDHVDAVLPQVVGRADAGQHQQLGRADRARRQDHLGLGPRGLVEAVAAVGHPGGPAALDQHPGHQRVGDDGEVPRPGGEVAVGGAAAPTVPLGDLVVPDPFLLRAVEVLVGNRAAADRRLDEVPGVLGLVPQVLDRQRPADAVVGALAAAVVLGPAEVRQQLPVPPAGAAEVIAPAVVVGLGAADVDHRVHRRGAAEDLAARPVDRAAVGALLREGHQVPVVPAAEEPVVGGGHLNLIDGAAVRARLQEKHPAAGVLGEPGRDHATCASAAHDHVIEHRGTLLRPRGPEGAKRGPAGPREPPDPRIRIRDYSESLFCDPCCTTALIPQARDLITFP